MALNLVSRVQVTASRFINKRNSTALSHHGVRLEYDPEARRVAALTLGVTLALVATAIMFVLSWFKPAGQVGNSKILADRDTGAIYVMVDSRLHPALNLMSARLIAGQAVNPTFVKAAEIQKYPQGPTVGIPGAPTAMPVRAGGAGQWAVCDSAPTATAMTSAGDRPLVTAIAGPLSGAGAGTLQMPSAVLTRHNGKTYILWDGRRSEVDLNNKAVALALGIDPGSPAPVPMSKALFDAIPATDPLVLPAIPDAGKPAPWNLGPGVVIGSVLSVRDLTEQDAETFYVLLRDGVEEVSPFVATVVRAANSFGQAAPTQVSPDALAPIPKVTVLPVSYYPPTRLELVDTTINTTTCLAWEKGQGDRAAETRLVSGQALPIPAGAESRLVRLVKAGSAGPQSAEADQVYIAPGAANLVLSTSAAPTAASSDSMWWISDQGVRFGIELDQKTLEALGVASAAAVQAPWPLIAVYSQGPALTRADAMTQHDSLGPVTGAAPLPQKEPGR
jgi:type VII secretion protein EccB